MKRTIIIMTKVPRAGNVKTRLQPFLTEEQCRALAEAFLSDAINKTENVCDDLIIAFAPAGERNFFNQFAVENLTLIEQSGADLGEKMSNAFEFAFSANSDANALIIGTDSPTFPAAFIEQTFAALESGADVVLGKSADGGFYLIGLNKNSPRLFASVEWSSPKVFEQITRNIETLNLNLRLLPEWFDIDAPEDLRRLRAEITGDERMQTAAPQTFRWLISNAKIFK